MELLVAIIAIAILVKTGSLGKTFGELTTDEKNQFSHRKNSLKKFIEWYSNQE